ncbi:BIR protein [Plasmodium berghei]|uniref:BIR protein n=4 Tax=Plasmodium berghei TaxID=5821 RepID=A0A509AQT9_PLABA|nr:BIR protein [Plasmodium berghei ANKA]XP_034423822.1 BIR protein [Plasmodium berghei ANKA]SBW38204.1 BIR protein [Plasmodium berghei]SCL82634.1 BIR protein [Plasmodium berghei]VUC55548.1 BIR protein [Plasmodium berghei ANKA]VUC58057.1 BIR protein [Plasmodium berghei ANKA]|eukprot:XP_034421358.1 BIR protein [Plasmodium berghei ANKA]
MNDDLCSNFNILRMYLPDGSGKTALDFYGNQSFKNYCPSANCNTELEKITIGFLWLLEQYYSMSKNKSHDINSINAFFIHMISWFSYKLKQNSEHSFTKINDFYTSYVKSNDKYEKFISESSKFTELNEELNTKSDLLNINIEDLSKFYDASKLICSMYGNVAMNKHENLPDNAFNFVNKYAELNNHNIEDTSYSKILSVLSTDYNNLKNKCSNIQSLPDIKTTQITIKNPVKSSTTNSLQNSEQTSAQSSGQIFAQTSEVAPSNSSIGNKLLTVLSIFGVTSFFLGISYKYLLFGRRKRAQKQYLREKIKNIKKRMNH